MNDDEPFLRRWSRRKTEADRRSADREPKDRDAGDAKRSESARRGPPDTTAPSLLSLPAVETLNGDSDFSVFMARGVPRRIRNAALRRLWQVDPALGVQDGLVEYGEDFTDAAKATGLVQTAFRIGRGMQFPSDPPETGEAESPPDQPAIESRPPGDDASEMPDGGEGDDLRADPPMRRRSS